MSARLGTTVVINGTYFGTSQGTSTVTFNGVTASPTNWTDTQISVPVPSGATSGSVVVTVNGAASNGFTFNVHATPTVTAISPSTGAAGTPVTITGPNLGDRADVVQVSFNGAISSATSPSEGSITVPVPSNVSAGSA